MLKIFVAVLASLIPMAPILIYFLARHGRHPLKPRKNCYWVLPASMPWCS